MRSVQARSVVGPLVIALARAAVRRLADAAPDAKHALAALDQIERAGVGPPYTVALAGRPRGTHRAARLPPVSAALDTLAAELP